MSQKISATFESYSNDTDVSPFVVQCTRKCKKLTSNAYSYRLKLAHVKLRMHIDQQPSRRNRNGRVGFDIWSGQNKN